MPRLLIRKGEGAGKDHALGAECVVGRQPGCTFVIDDLLASRKHFRVLSEKGGWFVEDMGSTNGTLLNGRKIVGKQPLSDGDVLSAGNTEMVFVQKDLLAAASPGVAKPAAAPAPAPGATASTAIAPAAKPPSPAAAPAPAAAPKKFDAPVPRKRRP
jgi:pSer/pThr/pTyr-binding forkhead associated (FHA) protein